MFLEANLDIWLRNIEFYIMKPNLHLKIIFFGLNIKNFRASREIFYFSNNPHVPAEPLPAMSEILEKPCIKFCLMPGPKSFTRQ